MKKTLYSASVPIVIDTGTKCWRAGLATEQVPSCTLQPSSQDIKNTSVIKYGLVVEFQPDYRSTKYYDNHIRHVCSNLKINPHGADILLSLPLNYSSEYRERLTEMVIEGMGANSVFYVSQPLLASYSSGYSTCLVVDSGYTNTNILAIKDLVPITESARVLPLGGKDVDRYLRELSDGKLNACNEADLHQIKSAYCSIVPRRPKEELPRTTKMKSIKLPDGNCILLGAELVMAPDILFNPAAGGLQTVMPVDQAAIQSALSSDQSASFAVLETVVMAGGNTMFPGTCDRMHLGIATRTVPRINKAVNQHQMGDLAVWLGGCAIALTNTYPKVCITKADYKEVGPQIVNERWL